MTRNTLRSSDLGIVALVPDRWKATYSTRHHVLTRLAERFPIAWLEPSLDWREHWLPRRQRTPEGNDPHPPPPTSLHVLPSHSLFPNVHRFPVMLRQFLRARVAVAGALLRRHGARRLALYIWRPEFADALLWRGHDFSCYHIDDEYSFSDIELPNSPEELRLIRGVDQVIVHSPRLLRKKGNINAHTAVVPNGVDYAAFVAPVAEPGDLRGIPHPRVGYIGVLKKQLDLQLMLDLARRHPQWSFVFVGPPGMLGEKAPLWQRLSALPNVHALGGRKVDELPAYAQHFDAAVMCYEVTDYTNSIFPLKLNEYLASGVPVVSSRVESVLSFGDVVGLATGVDEWETALAAALQPQAAAIDAVARRRKIAAQYDWDVLVDRVAELFLNGLSAPR
jgi:glycosyltransferase involved in cell wall biosynthesis